MTLIELYSATDHIRTEFKGYDKLIFLGQQTDNCDDALAIIRQLQITDYVITAKGVPITKSEINQRLREPDIGAV